MSFISDIKAKLPDVIKDNVFTDDDPARAAHTEPVKTAPLKPNIIGGAFPLASPIPVPAIGQAPITATTMEVDDKASANTLLDMLRSNTDFNKTVIGMKVAELMKITDGIPGLTDAAKMKIVLNAGASQGITVDSISEAVSGLEDSLAQESKRFEGAMTSSAQEVDSIKTEIQKVSDDITALEKHIEERKAYRNNLSSDAVVKESKIQRLQMNFKAAFETRQAELETFKQHYLDILKG